MKWVLILVFGLSACGVKAPPLPPIPVSAQKSDPPAKKVDQKKKTSQKKKTDEEE